MVNDSVVCIPKTTAQNILKAGDSLTRITKQLELLNRLNLSFRKQLQLKDNLINLKTKEVATSKSVADSYKLNFENCEKSYLKVEKKLKRASTISWILGSIAVVLGVIVTVK